MFFHSLGRGRDQEEKSDAHRRRQWFVLGLAVFLPLGFVGVRSAQSKVESFFEVDFAERVAAPRDVAPTPLSRKVERRASVEREPKSRYLAVHSQTRLSLYPLSKEGELSAEPADVLELASIQPPAAGSMVQGSQFVAHPRLNVIYECNLEAAAGSMDVHCFGFSEAGKLTRLTKRPVALDLSATSFRGKSNGLSVCIEPGGRYLYLTQTGRGGASGQLAEIPFYRLDSSGLVEGKQRLTRLPFSSEQFYGIRLEAGPAESDDVYGYVTSCAPGNSGSLACHFAVQADGSLKMDSQVQLGNGSVFRTQSTEGFLRDTVWGTWSGLRLDDQGRLLDSYVWPSPRSGMALYELGPGQALGLSHSGERAEATMFELDPEDDSPSSTPVEVRMPRFSYVPNLTLTDARDHQVVFFEEDAGGLTVHKIGLRNGRLRTFAPQRLEGCGPLNCSTGKIQIVSVY